MKLHSIDGPTQVGYAKQRPTVIVGAVCDCLDSLFLSIPYLSSFFPSPPTRNCRKSDETLPHRTVKFQHTLLETVDLVKMPWNFRHWGVSDIDHRQTGACCACSRCWTFLFAPLLVIVLRPQISGKYRPTHAASNSRSQFPHLCTEKLSRTCCACSRGGTLFTPYPIPPHPSSPLIMIRLKMTSLGTYQSNMIKNTTKRYVDCNAVSWFSICR